MRGAAVFDLLLERRCGHARAIATELRRIDADRAVYVLESLIAEGAVGHTELALDMIVSLARDADAPRFSQGLQSGRDVHAIAKHVIALGHDVAQMHADAKQQQQCPGPQIACRHGTLDVTRLSHGLDHRRKFGQEAVPLVLKCVRHAG